MKKLIVVLVVVLCSWLGFSCYAENLDLTNMSKIDAANVIDNHTCMEYDILELSKQPNLEDVIAKLRENDLYLRNVKVPNIPEVKKCRVNAIALIESKLGEAKILQKYKDFNGSIPDEIINEQRIKFDNIRYYYGLGYYPMYWKTTENDTNYKSILEDLSKNREEYRKKFVTSDFDLEKRKNGVNMFLNESKKIGEFKTYIPSSFLLDDKEFPIVNTSDGLYLALPTVSLAYNDKIGNSLEYYANFDIMGKNALHHLVVYISYDSLENKITSFDIIRASDDFSLDLQTIDNISKIIYDIYNLQSFQNPKRQNG